MQHLVRHQDWLGRDCRLERSKLFDRRQFGNRVSVSSTSNCIQIRQEPLGIAARGMLAASALGSLRNRRLHFARTPSNAAGPTIRLIKSPSSLAPKPRCCPHRNRCPCNKGSGVRSRMSDRPETVRVSAPRRVVFRDLESFWLTRSDENPCRRRWPKLGQNSHPLSEGAGLPQPSCT